MNYTNAQHDEAHTAWRSICGRGEKDLQEGTLRTFGITRATYVATWLSNVYGG